jgi:prepilin-type processing-associated H-X9-DG protein
MQIVTSKKSGSGFSLAELLVVLGIITVLLALLLPALARARDRGNQVVCESNLRQIGVFLLMYANQSRGWLCPVGPEDARGKPTTLGSTLPRDERWPVYALEPRVWNPPILRCPSDFEPAEEHSYVLNEHLADHKIKYSDTKLGGRDSTEVVVMGEKVSDVADYYMERNEFARVVEPFRHGLSYGSNYLYLDLHVSTVPPDAAKAGVDPWEPPLDPIQPPAK